ncbi:RNA polymerase, sigma 28 subunit, FliA/WhiG [Thermodesulfatator indicus DSM 15286]|uniref:RNA polymerase, sigma 28 subunit, FliA/WhiG n=1 Tax=Thermodesulfatator indicus (strain DSM 15286 / JCM 11887 / CIR29812) TaxID=667014 RepID=F8A9D4_THEID|nr:FliA/WhiG family RNA polymerase sigma factor [Thermodesulfatator indicus]AEH44075.1 RNA polymerase, sigma 28 subunit, FliA/WhiG [Thermodesulfatator indicus DSM 15286]
MKSSNLMTKEIENQLKQEFPKNMDLKRRNELIIKYAPLIKFIAGRLAMRLPPNVDINDLISAGIMGLIDAINRFDPERKIQFKTFAEFRIRGAMLDELRSLDWVPRSIRKKANMIEKAYQELEQSLGRPAEDEEVAEALGISIDEFHKMLEETKNVSFIDIETIKRKLPDLNEEDIFDLIEDPDQPDPFEECGLKEIRDLLAKYIDELPEKEKLVLSLYYYEGLTMREIGEILGYTESRISQLHSKALKRLRAKLKGRVGKEFFEEL